MFRCQGPLNSAGSSLLSGNIDFRPAPSDAFQTGAGRDRELQPEPPRVRISGRAQPSERTRRIPLLGQTVTFGKVGSGRLPEYEHVRDESS